MMKILGIAGLAALVAGCNNNDPCYVSPNSVACQQQMAYQQQQNVYYQHYHHYYGGYVPHVVYHAPAPRVVYHYHSYAPSYRSYSRPSYRSYSSRRR